jgi:hypothetical protein
MIAASMTDLVLVGQTPLVQIHGRWLSESGTVPPRGCMSAHEIVGTMDGLSIDAFCATSTRDERGPTNIQGESNKNVVTLLCDTGERYVSLEDLFAGVTVDALNAWNVANAPTRGRP